MKTGMPPAPPNGPGSIGNEIRSSSLVDRVADLENRVARHSLLWSAKDADVSKLKRQLRQYMSEQTAHFNWFAVLHSPTVGGE